MARRKTRVKDKWREKRWITVLAPDSFNNIPVAYIPITNDESAKGRVIELTLFDILKGDPSQHQYKVYFQIDKVNGDRATTVFKRYEYAKEFLRSLIRRGSSKISFTLDEKTKDGNTFRIKMIILTHRQLNTSRKHALRLIAQDVMKKTIPQMNLDQFVQASCYGKINSDILAAAKKIIRVRHVGLEKVKLLKTAEAEIALLEA
jgi:small subunit ribosomal protein S3Ae